MLILRINSVNCIMRINPKSHTHSDVVDYAADWWLLTLFYLIVEIRDRSKRTLSFSIEDLTVLRQLQTVPTV